MIDKAENAYVEPIFNEFPELYDIYDGFTLYKNTVSYNQGTLLGAPPLYGGYEYTPAEINKRSTVRLVDKQNEALLTLPRIFTESADFKATVTDLSWANYSWIADMSICDAYPKIDGFNVERKYTDLWIKQNPEKVKHNITSNALKRNLTWFSLFKAVPVFVRDSIYNDGSWWSSDNQTSDIMEFIDFYSALDFLPELTDFSSDSNAYFTIVNEATHSSDQKLQPPEYEPAINVTNEVPEKIKNYDGISCNIAALKRIGDWIEYLKENNCYDNTRIILVSDHGIGSKTAKLLNYSPDWSLDYNPDHSNPLLLVKDFNSKGKLVVNNDFMTNADVPSIALKGIVDNPINPFTKKEIKEISPFEKKASGIDTASNWRPGGNGIYTFKVPDDAWYTVKSNIFDEKNWEQGIK